MDYKYFQPPPKPTAPTKEDVLRHIESDHYVAAQAGDKELMDALDKRYEKVQRASADKALDAYNKAVDDFNKERLPPDGGRSNE